MRCGAGPEQSWALRLTVAPDAPQTQLRLLDAGAETHHGATPRCHSPGASLVPAAAAQPAAQEAGLSSTRPAGKQPLQRLLGKFLSKRAAAKFSRLYF